MAFAGLVGQAALLAAGRISSRQLVEATVGRIEAHQPTVGAFRVVRAEAALAEAATADRRLAGGERLPLLGVPVAVKDDVDVAGETTPFGCVGEHQPAGADSALVACLRAAGAVIVGKTSASEFGQWPTGEIERRLGGGDRGGPDPGRGGL